MTSRSSKVFKYLRRAAMAAVVFALLAALALVWLVRRPWPRTEGTVALPGLEAPVEILRDASGVAHIYAESDHDLFFAQGFVHAQDRLWSMDFDRRLASGRLSEVIGPMTLRLDRYLRTLGARRHAEKDLPRLAPETRALIEAYCDGINAFLETDFRRPIEYTLFRAEAAPWEPVDVIVRGKLMSWLLSQNQQFEVSRARMLAHLGEEQVQELLPPYRDGAPLIVPPESGGYSWLQNVDTTDEVAAFYGGPTANWGSNHWSVAGHRTASGKPILANDTHLEMAMPSVWYHNGLHGGSFDVVGASLPGVPGVILGTNGRIAWGVTDMLPDVQDFYIEKLDDPENPQRYEYQGEWHDLEIVTEEILVKGSEPFLLDVYVTRHGPIMNGVIGRLADHPEKLAVRWAEHDQNRLLDAVFALNRASDWASFRQALSSWDGPHMNFGYADADGHIGYQSTGRIPIRAPGHQGLMPVPGWTGENEWQSFIPFEELPHLLDPPDGEVYSANNKVIDDSYPYHLAYEWSDPYRAIRIGQLLGERKGLGLEDMKAMQLDSYSLHAEALRPVLLAVTPTNEVERRALELVESWDLRLETGSAAAAIHQVWYRNLLRRTVGDELGETLTREYRIYYWIHGPMTEDLVRRPEDPWFDDVSTPEKQETLPDIATASFQEAVAWLSEHWGKDPDRWSWGDLHPSIFGHRPLGRSGIGPVENLFNGAPVPTAGDRFTLNAAWFSFDAKRPFATNGGPGQRLIVDLADPDASLFAQNSGQVEHLFHPHRMDLTASWQAGRYQPLPFTRQAVEGLATKRLELKPAGESQ